MLKDPGKTPPKTAATEMQTLDEQIHLRAYELYEAGGREDGHDLDDWLRAEKEITQQKTRTVAA